MQKKELVINLLLAALAVVLLVLCIRSVAQEVKYDKAQKEFVEHVRNQ